MFAQIVETLLDVVNGFCIFNGTFKKTYEPSQRVLVHWIDVCQCSLKKKIENQNGQESGAVDISISKFNSILKQTLEKKKCFFHYHP